MQLIIFGAPILIGFVLGYFFNTTVIISISVLAAIAAVVLRPKREQEIAALFGVIAWIVLGIGFVVMWGTHFYVTETVLGLPDIGQYIFR